MTDYAYILTKAYPGKQWCMNGDDYSGIIWLDGVSISQAELDAAYIQYKADNEYIEKRSLEYPPVKDQLDMLWKAMDSGELPKATEFYNAIKAVKDRHPRGRT